MICTMKQLLILSMFIFSFLDHSTAQGMLGQKAPSWDIGYWIDANGDETQINLEDYDGKVIYILAFQSWCPGCHSVGFPTLKKVKENFEGSEDLEFFVVQTVFEGHSSNTKDKLRSTQEKYDLKIPFGHDVGSENTYPDLMTKYQTRGTPWVIIIDKKGEVRYSQFHIETAEANSLLKDLLK